MNDRPEAIARDEVSPGWDLREYLVILRTRKWPFIGTTASIVILVGLFTFAMRPIYRATCLLLIEPKGTNVAKVDGVYDPIVPGNALSDYYRTQFVILRSRRIIEPVATELRIAERPEFRDQRDPVEAFTETVVVDPIRESRLVRVAVESHDKEFATAAANAIVEQFVEENSQRTLGVSDKGLQKLKEMERSLRPKYETAAHVLQEFKETNNIFTLDESQSIAVQQLRVLSEEVSKARADRARAAGEAKIVSAAVRNGELEGPLPEFIPSRALDDLKVELAKVEQERDDLLKHYTPDHPAMRGADARVDRVRRAFKAEVAALVGTYQKRLEAEEARVAELEQAISKAEDHVGELGRKAVRLQFLKEEYDAVAASYKNVTTRIEEVEVAIATGTKENNLFVIDRALPPKLAIRPRKGVNLTLGAVFAAIVALLLCLLLEYLDQTIKTKEDAEAVLGYPLLGFVPRADGESPIELSAMRQPRGSVAEAFRSIRTGLGFTLPPTASTALVVTSATPRDGKSFVSINLAFALAQTGKRVLLVDADLRRPRIHSVFGLGERNSGLSTTIVQGGQVDLRAVCKTNMSTLDVLPSGPSPPNPAELLVADGMRAFLDTALAAYEWVILDAPPVTVVADPTILMGHVRHAVFVVRAFATDKRSARRAHELLAQSPGAVVGLVINTVDAESHARGYYGAYKPYQYYEERRNAEGAAYQAPSQHSGQRTS